MARIARDLMTEKPACCTPQTPLEQVAKLMLQHDCGEIPVVDAGEKVVGVVTDRDIVCRVVAAGKNPLAYVAETCMSELAVTVPETAELREVMATMEKHQIRRVPVVDASGRCVGIVSQADLAWTGAPAEVAELVREISRDIDRPAK